MRNPRIILIGNGAVHGNHADFVAASEIVIRFNLCRNYKQGTGEKTDILCVVNEGYFGRKFYKTAPFVALPAAQQAPTIWFSRPALGWMQNARWHVKDKRRKEYSQKIIRANGLSRKAVFYLPSATQRAAAQALQACSSTPHGAMPLPSSGMTAVMYLLTQPAYATYPLFLMGFSHQGATEHDWQAEQKYLEDQAQLGRLTFLR